jgi:hypothetical protein
VNVTFKYPKSVKDPSIPNYIDKTSTVYPLECSFLFVCVCLLTGPEYLLAKQQGCKIEINSACISSQTEKHPVKQRVDENEKVEFIQPYHVIIKEIKSRRRGIHI